MSKETWAISMGAVYQTDGSFEQKLTKTIDLARHVSAETRVPTGIEIMAGSEAALTALLAFLASDRRQLLTDLQTTAPVSIHAPKPPSGKYGTGGLFEKKVIPLLSQAVAEIEPEYVVFHGRWFPRNKLAAVNNWQFVESVALENDDHLQGRGFKTPEQIKMLARVPNIKGLVIDIAHVFDRYGMSAPEKLALIQAELAQNVLAYHVSAPHPALFHVRLASPQGLVVGQALQTTQLLDEPVRVLESPLRPCCLEQDALAEVAIARG